MRRGQRRTSPEVHPTRSRGFPDPSTMATAGAGLAGGWPSSLALGQKGLRVVCSLPPEETEASRAGAESPSLSWAIRRMAVWQGNGGGGGRR